MIQRDYLIIGSGIGGSSVCEGIRKFDKKGSVTLVGNETFHLYKRWMLSKQFLRDKTPALKSCPASTIVGMARIRSRRVLARW